MAKNKKLIRPKPKISVKKPKNKKTDRKPVKKKISRKKIFRTKFKKKQRIVYPVHGIGTITDIIEKMFIDEKMVYYKVEFEDNRLTMHIPVRNSVSMGMRPLSNVNTVKECLKVLAKKMSRRKDDWKSRHIKNMEKVKSGLILNTAEVTRDLCQRDRTLGLSAVEKRLYNDARHLLVSEMALVLKRDVDTVEDIVKNAISGRRIRL